MWVLIIVTFAATNPPNLRYSPTLFSQEYSSKDKCEAARGTQWRPSCPGGGFEPRDGREIHFGRGAKLRDNIHADHLYGEVDQCYAFHGGGNEAPSRGIGAPYRRVR